MLCRNSSRLLTPFQVRTTLTSSLQLRRHSPLNRYWLEKKIRFYIGFIGNLWALIESFLLAFRAVVLFPTKNVVYEMWTWNLYNTWEFSLSCCWWRTEYDGHIGNGVTISIIIEIIQCRKLRITFIYYSDKCALLLSNYKHR